MDYAALTAFISPFLPHLLKTGNKVDEKFAETGVQKFGESAWAKAQAIWTQLRPKLEGKEAAKEAAMDVADHPEDRELQIALRVQLKKLLDQDEALWNVIAQILQADGPAIPPRTEIIQTVTGDRNQVIGQVSGGQVFGNITGNVTIGTSTHPDEKTPATQDSTSKDAPPAVKTILVLAANPKGTNPLRLGEEVRSIQTGLERSQYRDRFRIEQRWAVTATDVRRALLDCKPQIVHFSGHGVGVETPDDQLQSTRKLSTLPEEQTQPEGLMFEDETGQPHLVTTEAIATLFSLFADEVECVLLNACYSATQADAITEHIPFVVGMKRAIGDRAAIEFAIGFYDGLLAGRTVDFAFKLGCSAIQMEGIPEHLTPALKQKQTKKLES
ncbi:MAG: CHAT domain-containing protein [Thermosynechococcaceae cyanobacterium]